MNKIKLQKRSGADKQHWKMYSTGERYGVRESDLAKGGGSGE